MKWIKYSRYTGEDFGVDADDLLKALADFLLQSGFNSQYMPGGEWDEHTLENLKQAIQQALESGKLFNEDALQEMMERLQNLSPEQMDQLLDNLIQKMVNEGQITVEEPGRPVRRAAPETGRRARSSSKSPTNRWIFWASKRSRTCSARWAAAASAATIRAIWPPGSRPTAPARATSLATR